jgi:hypothetical protein
MNGFHMLGLIVGLTGCATTQDRIVQGVVGSAPPLELSSGREQA